MGLLGKDPKLLVDLGAWFFNVVTSVGIIMVNKQLLSTYGFNFAAVLHRGPDEATLVVILAATTLTGCHFLMTSLMMFALRNLGIGDPNTPSHLFVVIAKLSMIPVSCLLEMMFDKIRYSRDVKLSIMVVLLGVGVCTVSDISVNAKGFIAASIAVWCTSMQQYFFIVLSCVIAVGTNLSQFICIGRFTAVSFQVLGHMKTVLVLVLGFLFFGKEGLNVQTVLGMGLAVLGMVWYGNASAKPGGKERSPPTPAEKALLAATNAAAKAAAAEKGELLAQKD
eukprot:SM000195S05272  [mRNA]  locus=s195:142901:144905:+ [translate_table: standard]